MEISAVVFSCAISKFSKKAAADPIIWVGAVNNSNQKVCMVVCSGILDMMYLGAVNISTDA